MSDKELTWVDAPPRSSRPGNFARYLVPLRAHPGQWAEIHRYPAGTSYNTPASRGHGIAKRHPDIEYATRTVGTEIVLYLRCKPDVGAS